MTAKGRLLATGFLIGIFLLAFEAGALRITPVSFDLGMPKGASASFKFTVNNNEGEPLAMEVGLCDWKRSMRGENLFCGEAGEVARSATSWLRVAPTQFDLEPEEEQEVRFTVSVPEEGWEGTPLVGSYWTAVMVAAHPQQGEKQEGTTVVVKRRFGLKVLVTVAGTGEEDGQVRNLQRYGLNPLWFSFEFENRGTLNLKEVSGRLELRDTSGKALETIPIGPFPILPGATRRLTAASSRTQGDPYPPGKYVALAVLEFGKANPVGAQLIFEIPPLDLEPIDDAEAQPNDPDGDAFYEDVNGDGQLTLDDPTLLGFNLDAPAVQGNWPAFDFNNDGRVDFDDVITLKEEIESQGLP